MGDLASSLYALGYHEKVDEKVPTIPKYLVELRKAALARIYTGDKSLAIFLGRPPRIVRPYCLLQIPSYTQALWSNDNNTLNEVDETSALYDPSQSGTSPFTFRDTDPISRTADTCCAALFACFKEEILGFFRGHTANHRAERAREVRSHTLEVLLTTLSSELRSNVERQWSALPQRFKLGTSLRECPLNPFERDFLVSTRLDYLHTILLLDLSVVQNISEPSDSLLSTAREMLSHVVDTVVLRERLVNSGTCLIWKGSCCPDGPVC